MGINVGIDLGTTFSAVARIDNFGKPEIIGDITPSVLYFEDNGNILFGEEAKEYQEEGEINSVSFFKRMMGNSYFSLDINGKSYNATDFSAIFLKKLKQEAERIINDTIDGAVITVPAYFDNPRREATMEAGRRAGLNVLSIINEPTAAAFAYGLHKMEEQTVLIYDLGGGTFDVTIAKINYNKIDILGSDGNHELGGKDWDDCIRNYIISEYKNETDIDLSDNISINNSLLVKAENIKKQLTQKDSVDFTLNVKGNKVKINITNDIFESISSYYLGITKDVINKLLNELEMTWSNIDGVILVGGSTRMRMVKKYIKEMTGKEPLSGVDPDAAVALGAAIRANITESGSSTLSIGSSNSSSYSSSPSSFLGAQAISDCTSHAMGLIVENEDSTKYVNSVIIPKNSSIPAKESGVYDFQISKRSENNMMEVYVLQGSFERPLDNTVVNKYNITGFVEQSSKDVQVEVTYAYNSNGIVEVEAKQLPNIPLTVTIDKIPEDMSWTDGSPKDNPNNKPKYVECEVYLAVDVSGSMHGQPLSEAKKAMTKFVNDSNSECTKIGIMCVSDRTKVKCSATSDYSKVRNAINSIVCGETGGGNADEPFSKTYDMLRNSDAEVKYLVVLADGVWAFQYEAIERAKKCHKAGIQVAAIGFGEADEDFLEAISSVKDLAIFTDLSKLSESFSTIAKKIGSQSNSGSGPSYRLTKLGR